MKIKLNIEIPSYNPQEIESFTKLINILRSRANINTLKINELIRKKEENKNKSKNRRNSFINEDENKDFNINVNNRSSLDVQSIEEEQSNNIRHRDRDVITNQISEIGEIMEEIGIHVSMQEESFKRIDDLMIQTDDILSTSVSMLKKTLFNIKSVRGSIVKFFIFWFVIVIIFWVLRR
ncbi:hypothetical protein NBO_1157g0003 [Nosema bombycis CQ1]|uniref:t-SNARE coiled-coil homology domain-containing protein n=1 Tax=Nosema bombycis (strain CQ1 / CVCC 102059) TaxID=578461 RepID=R0KLH8_NOSB1|nr:hypothetical protein NBO_1157g0003 [Nosema bombycis CQ1]|eukprot:EOB11471.1 hypothetical protein NBO_1157g0003 [Nosema bombycis CQ1]